MNKLLSKSAVLVKRNAPTILTVIGGIGVGATAIMAVKATPKATKLLEQAKKEKGEELTKFEVVKVAGPSYIPAAITGVATIACIFGANILNKKKQAAIMSAYALLDSSYKEYRNKVTKLFGEDADRRVKEEIAKDKYAENDIYVTDDKELFYDSFSERYFESTMAQVVQAEYNINRKISMYGGAYLNEFYEELDIPPLDHGEHLGWSSGSLMDTTWIQWLDFHHEKVEMEDGMECYIITMSTKPMLDFY